eukprot:15446487-Alexandrium_andersonii.AAC.1
MGGSARMRSRRAWATAGLARAETSHAMVFLRCHFGPSVRSRGAERRAGRWSILAMERSKHSESGMTMSLGAHSSGTTT